MKVQIEIEIPDGHEIVDMEVLADECPRHCSDSGKLLLIKTKAAKPFLINGVPSDWPDWLTADYVAKDKSEECYGYIGEPRIRLSIWGDAQRHFPLAGLIAVDIPGPWEQSLRENPRRKNKEVSE